MLSRRIVTLFVFIILSVAPTAVLAAGFVQVVPASCTGQGGCQTVCDIATLAQNILNDAIYLAVVISAFLFAWAGFKMLTANGNVEQVSSAKKIFTDVAVGLVIILVGWLVVDALMSTLMGGHLWNKIC